MKIPADARRSEPKQVLSYTPTLLERGTLGALRYRAEAQIVLSGVFGCGRYSEHPQPRKNRIFPMVSRPTLK